MNRQQMTSAYRLISELFLYPEDRDIAVIETERAGLKDAPEEFREPIEAFFAAPAAMSTQEYVKTLELTPVVPLYLGAHLYDEPKSCRGAGMSWRNGYMIELTNIYRHFGVEFAGREMSDFVPVVIEFLGISLERRDQDDIGLRRYLVETLVVEGFDNLLVALRKYESPYGYLVEALSVTLADDIALMASGPKWRPSADDDAERLPPNVAGLPMVEIPALDNGVKL